MVKRPNPLKLRSGNDIRLEFVSTGYKETRPMWKVKISDDKRLRVMRDLSLMDVGNVLMQREKEFEDEDFERLVEEAKSEIRAAGEDHGLEIPVDEDTLRRMVLQKKIDEGSGIGNVIGYVLSEPLTDEGEIGEQRKAIRELSDPRRREKLDEVIQKIYDLANKKEPMKHKFYLFSARRGIDERSEYLMEIEDAISGLEEIVGGTTSEPLQEIGRYMERIRDSKEFAVVPTVERTRKRVTISMELTKGWSGTHKVDFTKVRKGKNFAPVRTLWNLGNHITAGLVGAFFTYRPQVCTALGQLIESNEGVIDGLTSLLVPLETYRAGVELSERLSSGETPLAEPKFRQGNTNIRALENPIPALLGIRTVPNDYSATDDERFLLITGANNGGKTYFAKSVGMSHLLAQRGFDLAAEGAEMSLVDRVYTHFVEQDDPIRGEGRYKFELRRMGEILDSCTRNSLIIVDEPCGGTEPEKGMVQSRYFVEALKETGAQVIFTTHYHPLARDLEEVEGVRNLHPDTRLVGGELEFYHQMLGGPAGTSYALEIAENMDMGREALMKKARAARVRENPRG